MAGRCRRARAPRIRARLRQTRVAPDWPPWWPRRFVGEWYEPEDGQGAPTEEQTAKASGNCFAVGGIYLAFTAVAIMLTCYFERRSKARA